MLLPDKISVTPFLRVFVLLAAGILSARLIQCPFWFLCTAAVGVYGLAWLLRKTVTGFAYLYAGIWLTGLLLADLSAVKPEIPTGQKVYMIVEITDTPDIRTRWQRTTARVGYYRPAIQADTTSWIAVNEKIQLYIDTARQISYGEQLAVTGYLNPIDTTESSYGRLMKSRGKVSRGYISANGVITRIEPERKALRHYATGIHEWGVRRLSRLRINDTNRHIVLTLIAGERKGLDPTLRADYAKTGVSHVLAVSGLHMGFVLIFANLLSGWIVLFRRGHLYRNIIVILLLWLYAVMAGLGPSVVRAALMMTAVQLAFGLSERRNGYNLLFGAATLMLAVNPNYLYDISFQLSFVAVFFIMFLYPRLYRRKFSRNKWVDRIWSTVLVSVAAQIGTAPLIAYSFGLVAVIGVLVNPIVVLLTFLIMCTGFCWLLLPIPVLNTVFSFIIDSLLHMQNSFIRWCAGLTGTLGQNISMSGWQVTLLYAILLMFMVGWKIREEKQAGRIKLPG